MLIFCQLLATDLKQPVLTSGLQLHWWSSERHLYTTYVLRKYDLEHVKSGLTTAGGDAELKAQSSECDEIPPQFIFSAFSSHYLFFLTYLGRWPFDIL